MHQWALTSVAVTKSCSGTVGATNRSTTDEQTTDQSKPVDSKSPCMVESNTGRRSKEEEEGQEKGEAGQIRTRRQCAACK